MEGEKLTRTGKEINDFYENVQPQLMVLMLIMVSGVCLQFSSCCQGPLDIVEAALVWGVCFFLSTLSLSRITTLCSIDLITDTWLQQCGFSSQHRGEV